MRILFVLIVAAYAICNDNDRQIYKARGSTFKTQFRSYGGLWVGQEEFEEKVVRNYGLSATCARCYGNAYICGKDNCKWDCKWDSEACDTCTSTHHCDSTCNECTGFK